MTLGERGGVTASAEEGFALVETHKPVLSNAIRFDILDWLESHSTWHRNDLRVEVPADSKNAVGAVVSGLISSGAIVETGERRKSADPASHSRKSNVYRLAGARGSQVGTRSCTSAVSSSGSDRTVGEAATRGGQSSAGVSPSCAPVDPPRLFEVSDRPSHFDVEAA